MLLLSSCCSNWPMTKPVGNQLIRIDLNLVFCVIPPKLDTSTTFGTDLNCFSSIQSSSDFNSMMSYSGFVLFSVYR